MRGVVVRLEDMGGMDLERALSEPVLPLRAGLLARGFAGDFARGFGAGLLARGLAGLLPLGALRALRVSTIALLRVLNWQRCGTARIKAV